MAEIVPTILTSDFSQLSERMELLKGITPRVQIDIIDGKFAENQTVSIESLKEVDIEPILDLHLMVKEPAEWINRTLEVLPDQLIGQVEMMENISDFINQTVEAGMRAGIALDLETPVESISEEDYHLADTILLLSVKAGFGGQRFDSRVLTKVEKLKSIVGDLVEIGIDGGLGEEEIILCKKAGASVFNVGASFWQPQAGILSKEDLLKRYQDLTGLIA
jgi:ribulose-phosphate 3-epimerase